jgi:hypothetical protein
LQRNKPSYLRAGHRARIPKEDTAEAECKRQQEVKEGDEFESGTDKSLGALEEILAEIELEDSIDRERLLAAEFNVAEAREQKEKEPQMAIETNAPKVADEVLNRNSLAELPGSGDFQDTEATAEAKLPQSHASPQYTHEPSLYRGRSDRLGAQSFFDLELSGDSSSESEEPLDKVPPRTTDLVLDSTRTSRASNQKRLTARSSASSFHTVRSSAASYHTTRSSAASYQTTRSSAASYYTG